MEGHQQDHLRALLGNCGLEVRKSGLGGEGLFAITAIEADTVLFADIPLCWQPEPPCSSRLPPHTTCSACGRFLGSASELLTLLAGDDPATAPSLPVLDDAPTPAPLPAPGTVPTCGEGCPRGPPAFSPGLALCEDVLDARMRSGWEQVQLGAQLLYRLAQARSATQPRAASSRLTRSQAATWRTELEALASPPWSEVCAADVDDEDTCPSLPTASIELVRKAFEAGGLAAAASLATEEGGSGAALWSRVLGAVARNAIWVQVPNVCVS